MKCIVMFITVAVFAMVHFKIEVCEGAEYFLRFFHVSFFNRRKTLFLQPQLMIWPFCRKRMELSTIAVIAMLS